MVRGLAGPSIDQRILDEFFQRLQTIQSHLGTPLRLESGTIISQVGSQKYRLQ